MCAQESFNLRLLVPLSMVCAGLPFVIRALLPEDPDFGFLALGLGCGVLAAIAFSPVRWRTTNAVVAGPPGGSSVASTLENEISFTRTASEDSTAHLREKESWTSRMTPVLTLALGCAAVFVAFGPNPREQSGLPVPLLAFLTLAPGLGIVPYLTLRTRKPFAAVVFTASLVASIKLASCVVVRIVHGPTALEDGYMAADWQTAKLMISLFWIGTLALSVVLAVACRRHLVRDQFTPGV